ncbi:hypothetical protein [Nesterenkonia sandarakina]|uniref:Uncharacterized protein n=1 Tax=Nesterenkonia sandarakina TaxID=272918 RepID=A0A7Z0J2K2_9MICC|nr:hypothetical protein [Nesterenkonia sandarakina]NYJ16312.1 hypothetical protein [Nesterenkonia sandarakina]
MDAPLQPPAPGRRVLFCAAGAALGAVLILLVALPLDVIQGFLEGGDLIRAAGSYALAMIPVAGLAGALGGGVGAYSRWSTATRPRGTAVLAGVTATGVGAMATFGLLWAPLAAWAQIGWIILIGAGAAFGSRWLDARLAAGESAGSVDATDA